MGKAPSIEQESDSRPKSAHPDLSFSEKQNQIAYGTTLKKLSPPPYPPSFFENSLTNSLTGPSPIAHSPPTDSPEGNQARRSVSFNDKTENKKIKELSKKEREKQQKALDKKNKQKIKKQNSKVPE